MVLINASRWPITRTITMQSKSELTQCLLLDELVYKRDTNIRALRKGMMVLGFFDFCMKHLELVEPLFIHDNPELTVERFLSLIHKSVESPDPDLEPKKARAFQWWIEYLHQRSNVITADNLEQQGIGLDSAIYLYLVWLITVFNFINYVYLSVQVHMLLFLYS